MIMTQVFDALLKFLENAKVPFRHVEHAPTYTSEESAAARDEPLEIGAKAIVMKVDDTFALFVMSATEKVDSKQIKALTGCRSLRFATPEELLEQTTLVPGSIPPFGKPILPYDLYIDFSIQQLPKVAFNAGSLTNSIVMGTEDYLALSKGKLSAFSK
jgi:Ala-tRNA(Pro) deacylase